MNKISTFATFSTTLSDNSPDLSATRSGAPSKPTLNTARGREQPQDKRKTKEKRGDEENGHGGMLI